MAGSDDLPESMAGIVEDFQAMSERDRLQLLLDFSRELPPLPPELEAHRDAMEPVPECQSPVFLRVDVDPDSRVHLWFDAPREAPTTRGFASILREGLDGLTAPEVLAVPDDVPDRLGIGSAVSPLRLRGMAGMLARIKRQVREKQVLVPDR
ncbi:MAG TPA: SufE family protein [Kineosporiaceae bacterium]|nr:SufE family protein [Kineosporiaceae bacterium]